MGYIIDFAIIGIVATFLAGLAALIAAALPVKSKRFRTRLIRGAATFFLVWFGCATCGFIELSRTHNASLRKADGVEAVPGLLRSSDQVLRAERVYRGDTAQTYILVKITGDEIEAFTSSADMKIAPFDAHTVEERGWHPPDWWPNQPCTAGVTYGDDPFGNPPRHLDYVINWCPSEDRAYIQHFDY